jgi:hypothetical protein
VARFSAVIVNGVLSLSLIVVAAAAFQPAPYRVLFIGNSLTYSNDLPAMVATMGRAEGRRIECESIALPDFSLEDHWQRGDAPRAIARGGWTMVILQQGPSALPESRVLLVEYAKRFDREIRKVGATTALFMVWPSRARRGDFAGVSGSYAAAAKAVGGVLLPAGDAWREAWKLDATLPLYGPDGLHPSPTGSYLAALVIYQQIAGDLPRRAPVWGATPEQAELLQRAAAAFSR